MKFKHKNILVYGVSLSGECVSKLLLKLKANVFLFDDDLNLLKQKRIANCYVVEELSLNFVEQLDYIIVSPGVEKENKFLKHAYKKGIKIYSEVEFASQFCKNYVAITGTNGKTTTVKLIAKILSMKHKAVACGNNGYPLSRAVMENKKAIKVVEVSSFMLENASSFSPSVASVLNIEQDHLIRHKTMEEYSRLKMSIFKNLTVKNYAVVNLDNKITPNVNCKQITYSYNKIADVYVKNGYIFLHNKKIIAINELKLKGKHNVYNVMCAICFGVIFKVKPQKIRQALLDVGAEKYRIEHIKTINGINFVNDSKSTNIASTLASVNTINGAIILLVGGSNKGLNYEELFENMPKKVIQVVAFGEIAQELAKANNLKFKLEPCSNLNEAFDFATKQAKPNDTVLLSPASASYDQFNNYAERGNAFNNKVMEYEQKQKE